MKVGPLSLNWPDSSRNIVYARVDSQFVIVLGINNFEERWKLVLSLSIDQILLAIWQAETCSASGPILKDLSALKAEWRSIL